MGKIRILSDNVVSKIAAGEIVERPASVVKELVENSIDAGSRSIKIELESGGKKLIEVSDDGEGMSRDEALLSLERHATSKIKDINDLFSVKSLGFRGEAIPSIASVSRFKITTRISENVIGTMISGDGGKIRKVEETGCPSGTSIQVKNLFYNTPVRLKFMRKIETELSNVLDIVQREAMSRPEISFEITSGGKAVLTLPKRDNLLGRLSDIFPNTELQSIYAEAQGVEVSGFMSSPLDTRSTTHKLFTYINQRAVRDKFLTRIVIDAYGKMLEKRKFPQGAIFIDIPTAEVDVNVHPTKNEVRFRNQRLIADLIRTSILQMLREAPWIKSYKGRVENSISEFLKEKNAQTNYENYQHVNRPERTFAEELGDLKIVENYDSPSLRDEIRPSKHIGHEFRISQNDPPVDGLFESGGLYSSLRIIGQIRELYIVCVSDNGMVLVDQHAAHERINYERLKRAYLENKELEVQELLVPEVLEFPPYESSLINKHLGEFESLGLRIEEFGNNSFLIRSVPALLKNVDSTILVKDVVSEIAGDGKEESLSEKIDLVIATMACHSSITAKFELSFEEMKALLEELDRMDFPHSCPHGRPVAQELSYYDIERMFKRT
ncbi:MAG: DNA mismatch repair endonuclease MutL [Thermodesulfobacteriales bacterium]|nr:MAG: DNA mismatch repair endonuclease MutL [Thermodesulfobacteriales bacterium]